MDEPTVCIPSDFDGIRLDRALEMLLPDVGLRQRRRMCEEGQIYVNGVPRKPAFRVFEGQLLEIRLPELQGSMAESIGVHVLKKDCAYAAIYKPEGVHTAAIAGRENVSVESLLPQMFPDECVVLLNRLDNPTSGIVLAALAPGAEESYHKCEEAGRITKKYYARVHGRLMHSMIIKNKLDTAGRKKTKVLAENDSDARRWTEVEPIEFGMESCSTLVRCTIRKGARHQIRAHLASQGHPILGDSLYGSDTDERLHLHHHHVSFDGFEAVSPPPF